MSWTDGVFPRHARLAPAVATAMAGRDLAHDLGHVRRVYAWAMKLAPEAGADPDLAGAAALVHDLDPTPKSDAARPLGGARSAVAAGPLLATAGYVAAQIEPILAAVATSSWSRGLPPAGPLGTVLQDADRLDAIGAIGIARTFACHAPMGGDLFDPDDPWGERGRALDDRAHALDHFARKLLRLAGSLHLPTARAEGARRHAAMVAFLDELRKEL